MKQYLSIVLRTQFNLFYRFGYTVFLKSELIEFDGAINDEIKKKVLKQFEKVPPFEYDEEFVILHLEKKFDEADDSIEFEIHELVAIYPLSQQAKISIESKSDQRMSFGEPVFESILGAIETKIEKKNVEKGIAALWKICGITAPIEKYVASIGLQNIFKGLGNRRNGVKAHNIQNGNFWEYLIAYDRYNFFPKSTLGYFYDASQVFAYSKGHQSFEGSSIHDFLEKTYSSEPGVYMIDLIGMLESEKHTRSYVDKSTVNGIKQYVVAPLFFMLRDEIRDSDYISQPKPFKNLDYLKSRYAESFFYSVVLLGAFFGFRKFYDPYYDVLNLRFHKKLVIPKEHNKIAVQDDTIDTEIKIDGIKATRSEEPKQAKDVDNNDIKRVSVDRVDTGEKKRIEINDDKGKTNLDYSTDEKEDIVSTYQRVIIQSFNEKITDVKISEIITSIKEYTGKRLNNQDVKSIAKEMEGVEIIKIKRAEGLRFMKNPIFKESTTENTNPMDNTNDKSETAKL